MKYKIAQTKDYKPVSSKYLMHSAKGTTWQKHKYIKVEDGRYFYPSDGQSDKEKPENIVESREPAGWDTKLFSSFENNLKGTNGKLDPKAVQQMLLFGKDDNGKGYDNFKVALNKAGIDTSEIDEKSLNLMRYKVVEHYKKEFAKEKDNSNEKGNGTKDKKGSSKSSSSAKSESEETTSKSSSKSSSKSKKKSTSKTKKTAVSTPTSTIVKKAEVNDIPKRKSVTNHTGTNYSPIYSIKKKR